MTLRRERMARRAASSARRVLPVPAGPLKTTLAFSCSRSMAWNCSSVNFLMDSSADAKAVFPIAGYSKSPRRTATSDAIWPMVGRLRSPYQNGAGCMCRSFECARSRILEISVEAGRQV
jgi:hypothetical protein